MLPELSAWPKKLKNGLDAAHNYYFEHGGALPKNVHDIFFVGMGGSGIAGRICKTFFDRETKLRVFLADGPSVPGHIGSDAFAIVSSYSGNTWETVQGLQSLIDKGCRPLILTHAGGKLAEIALEHNLPMVLLGESLTPRSALGEFLGFLFGLFDKMGLLSGQSKVEEMIALAKEMVPKYEDKATFSEFLAAASNRDFFHIWGLDADMAAFAFRAATQFNENSKVQAVFSSFPEVCHNLLASFQSYNQTPLVLFFATANVTANLDIDIDAATEILTDNGVVLYKPAIFGDTWVEQLFGAILWSDFASYHLAHERGVEVVPVALIDALKAKQIEKGIS